MIYQDNGSAESNNLGKYFVPSMYRWLHYLQGDGTVVPGAFWFSTMKEISTAIRLHKEARHAAGIDAASNYTEDNKLHGL